MIKKGLVSVPGAVWGAFLQLPAVVHALLILMALDVISGLILAGKLRQISSDRSFNGMARKAMQIIIIGAVAALAWGIGLPHELASAVAGAFCVTETISIVENAANIGVPIPRRLAELLSKLSEDQGVDRRRD